MQNLSNQSALVTLAPPSNGRRENYSSKQAKSLGVVQLILGVICFVCQIAAMVNRDAVLTITSAGLWGGITIIVAGGLGIGAAKRKTNCLIVAVMVMSIVAASSSFIIIVFSAWSLITRDLAYSYYVYRNDYNDRVTRKDCVVNICSGYHSGQCTSIRDKRCEFRVAMSSILLLCGVAELVVAIWASALCCAATCCVSTPQERTQGVVYHGPASQLCQITSTGGQMTMPRTAIGNVQYATPGQVIMLQHPAPIGNAGPPNYVQPAGYNPSAPAYSQDASQDLSDSQHYTELVYDQ